MGHEKSVTKVCYHETVKVLQAMDSLAPGPFDRSAWYALLAERGEAAIFAIGESETQPIILPLKQSGDRYDALTNYYSFSWRPIGADSKDTLAEIARSLKSRAARVVLSPVPNEDGSASALDRAFRDAGWAVQREQCDHNHVLPVSGRSFAEYWASRPGRMRTTLKRKAKKVECELLTSFDAGAWDKYCQVYDNSWKPEEGDPELLREFAEAEGKAGRLRLAIAHHEGQPVAAQFWTVENGIAYIHKLAHLEDFKPLSAGTTLSALLFEHVIDRDNVDLVDFGTGNDPYKCDWMELDRPRYRLDCLNPSKPTAWLPLAKRSASRLASTFRRG